MKAILGIMFLLVVLWCACGCVSGESKYDPQDTVQKPLPDSILVRDTSMKAQAYYIETGLLVFHPPKASLIIDWYGGLVMDNEVTQIRKRKFGL